MSKDIHLIFYTTHGSDKKGAQRRYVEEGGRGGALKTVAR